MCYPCAIGGIIDSTIPFLACFAAQGPTEWLPFNITSSGIVSVRRDVAVTVTADKTEIKILPSNHFLDGILTSMV